jgi:hypothetical protein
MGFLKEMADWRRHGLLRSEARADRLPDLPASLCRVYDSGECFLPYAPDQ